MTPHTITPTVGAVCLCKTKAGLRRSPRGLHSRTRLPSLLRLNLYSSLKTTWFNSLQSSILVRDTTRSECVDDWRQGQQTSWRPLSQMSFSQAPSHGSRRHRGF
ncbi:hypothetical protein TNCV_3477071 [Trichonephila clavipes]|nr:hypothetical protein TNCV_3477071 [Trichonephila clavipes]